VQVIPQREILAGDGRVVLDHVVSRAVEIFQNESGQRRLTA
jgi:hypothetical protein